MTTNETLTQITEADFRTHRRHMKRRFWWMIGWSAANTILTALIIIIR